MLGFQPCTEDFNVIQSRLALFEATTCIDGSGSNETSAALIDNRRDTI